jgi:hypothetical protein
MAADIRRLFGETKAALATIIYVGERICCGPTVRRSVRVTLIFGLAHGLGFATDLKEQLACMRP